MKLKLSLLLIAGFLATTSVTMANDPSPGIEQVSINKNMGITNPPVMELTITPTPALPYVVVIEQAANLTTNENQSQDGKSVSLIAGTTPVVSADRSVKMLGSNLLYRFVIASILKEYREGRATEYRC